MPEREWGYEGGSMARRTAEVMARMLIGGTWGVLLFVLISYLLPQPGAWGFVAYLALILWGIEMAIPPIKYEEEND